MVEKASKQAKIYPSSSSSTSSALQSANSQDKELNLEILTTRQSQGILTSSLPTETVNHPRKSQDVLDRVSELISVFRCIDVIMFRLQSRGQLALWNQVEENVQRFYSKTISIDDLCVILMVYPGAYTIDWHAVSGLPNSRRRDYQLSIQLPVYQLSNPTDTSSMGVSSPTTSTTTSTMSSTATKNQHHLSRMEHIASALEAWIKQGHSLLPDRTILPTKPNIVALDSNATSVARNVSRDLQSKRILAKIAKEEELSKFVDGSLSGLRNLAAHRESQEKEQAEYQLIDEQKALHRRRVDSLSRLAYVIRALTLQHRRKYQSVDEFINNHSEELGTSTDELKVRLKLLADECPEFLLVDRLEDIDAEVMQINKDCPMQLVQERIANLASSDRNSR